MKRDSLLHRMIEKKFKPADLTGDNLSSEFYLNTRLAGSAWDHIACMSSYEKVKYPEGATSKQIETINKMYDKLTKINISIRHYYSFMNNVMDNNYNSNPSLLRKMQRRQEHKIKMYARKIEDTFEETK